MQRNQSLDALRGFAILTMVLSGSIAFGDTLPAWMYHAQVPPPNHKFNPDVPGITWVDLVFPFFLFSMGAAIPLSLQKHISNGSSFAAILGVAVRRFLLLAFFALFTFHMRAWVIATTPTTTAYLLSILAFALLFFQLYGIQHGHLKKLFLVLKIAAFAAGIALLCYLPFGDKGFQWERSDIIIMVLANMALFGTLIWWVTKKKPLVRLAILPFVAAVFIGGKNAESWNAIIFNFSPFPWLYTFYFLKYLFIIIPGTFAGEWLLRSLRYNNTNMDGENKKLIIGISLLSLLLIVTNVIFLFARYLLLNLCITITVFFVIYTLLKKADKRTVLLMHRFFGAGVFLLLLGLFLEAAEGGIKKDPSNYSYYFVTGGLSFFMLILFYGMAQIKWTNAIVHYLSLNGRNPMVAYVAGSLFVTPMLHLTGLIVYFNGMNSNAWIGFLRGVLFTAIVSLITILFVKRGWFWKT